MGTMLDFGFLKPGTSPMLSDHGLPPTTFCAYSGFSCLFRVSMSSVLLYILLLLSTMFMLFLAINDPGCLQHNNHSYSPCIKRDESHSDT